MKTPLKTGSTTAPFALGLTALLLAGGCTAENSGGPTPLTGSTATADAVASDLIPAAALTTSSWTLENSTTPLPQPIVPTSQHKALPNVVLAGGPIVTSNNPETFTGTGWLTQHTYNHPTRGGNNTWLSGNFGVYVSHYNQTGATAYLQVIAVNPHTDRSINVSYRSAITSSSEAGVGDANGIKGRSNYYVASERALNFASIAPTTKTIPAGGAVLLALKTMNNGGSADGAMLVTADSPGVFTYVVASPTQYIEDGLALAHTPATRRATSSRPRPILLVPKPGCTPSLKSRPTCPCPCLRPKLTWPWASTTAATAPASTAPLFRPHRRTRTAAARPCA